MQLLFLATCFLTWGLCSCSPFIAYTGPERPDSEIAYVEGWNSPYPWRVSYGKLRIDGILNPSWTTSAKILPGAHWLVIEESNGLGFLWGSQKMRFCAFEMDFEAGHAYEILKNSINPKGPHLAKYDKIGEVYPGTILIKITGPNKISITQKLSVLCTTHFWGVCRIDAECGGTKINCIRDNKYGLGLCILPDVMKSN